MNFASSFGALGVFGELFKNNKQADDPAKARTAARIRRQIFLQEQKNLKVVKGITKEKAAQLKLDKAA
jgi:hypothetical protein